MHAFKYLEMLKNEVHDTLNGDMFTYLCMVTRYTDVSFHSISDNIVATNNCQETTLMYPVQYVNIETRTLYFLLGYTMTCTL